jgi:hypothetical protein
VLDGVQLGSSLLLDVEVGRGARNPFDVEGLEVISFGDFGLREMVRRIHDVDSRSVEGGVAGGDMMSSDMEGGRSAADSLSCQG